MNLIQESLQQLLPAKRKLTPSGWVSFNAPCCQNRGESRDTKQRGGVLINPTGGFQYHCFNCNFKAGWTPGNLLTKNTKSLFKWLGITDSDLNKLALLALQGKEDQPKFIKQISLELEEKTLPEDCKLINDWISEGNQEPELLNVVNYLVNERKIGWDWYQWMWSPANGYRDRVIVPFYHEGKLVGWTGRKITQGKPKYLTNSQPGYVFNLDHQTYDRQHLIVVEGPFDAIAIDAVAILHNDPNQTQCTRINSLGKEVIVVPDRDKPGAKLIEAALNNNWTVSLPPWEDHIKDVADAVKHYGRLYTLFTILHYKETNEIKIQLLKKKLEALNDQN